MLDFVQPENSAVVSTDPKTLYKVSSNHT